VIAVDDANVYWVAGGQTAAKTSIMRQARSGGPTELVAPTSSPIELLSDGSHLYWGLSEGILSVPVGGGSVVTLAPGVDQTCLAVDSENVYWTQVSATGSSVLSVPKAGGQVQTIASVNGSTAIVPFGIGLDDTSIYWVDGALFKVAKAGGTVTTLVGGSGLSGDAGLLDRGCALVVEGGSVLLLDMIGSAIDLVSVPSAGGELPTPLGTAPSPFIVVDTVDAFWISTQPTLSIDSIALDGGTPSVIVSPVAMSLYGLALSSDRTLYWTTGAQVQSFKLH
jgi:hypothetical protein